MILLVSIFFKSSLGERFLNAARTIGGQEGLEQSMRAVGDFNLLQWMERMGNFRFDRLFTISHNRPLGETVPKFNLLELS